METALTALQVLFVLLLCAAAAVDIRSRLIHKGILLAMLAAAAAKILLETVVHGMYLTDLWGALIAGCVTALVFYAVHRVTGGLGLGDVKLMAVVGLFYSIRGIFSIVLLSMLLVALTGVAMIAKNRKNLKATVPFAPFVALAALARQVLILVQA